MSVSVRHVVHTRKQVLLTKEEANKDNVVVPTTLQEYCVTSKSNVGASTAASCSASADIDYYDDDDDYVDDEDEVDDDGDIEQCMGDCEADSGHGDS